MKIPFENAAALAAAIGRRVRALREAEGLTQEKLAYECGLHSKGTLSKIESGQQLATVAVLDLLARRLGVELCDLFIQAGEGNARHDLVEASRRMSAAEIREILRSLARAATPFTEARRPVRAARVPTVVPLLGLDAAVGSFEGARVDPQVRWVRPHTARPLHPGCFVARVVGRSMEPTIPHGSWAVFTRHIDGDPRGKVVIAQLGGLVDADTATSFTVKRFRATEAARDAAGRWREVRLEPDNPEFESLTLRVDQLDELRLVAQLVEVLATKPRSR